MAKTWVQDERLNAADLNEAVMRAGMISLYGGAVAPSGYLICDGAAVSRTTYADLFTAIGTTYGAGNGSTTFNLPNLKGRVPVGVDPSQTEFDALGENGGSKTHTLTVDEMPSHNHRLGALSGVSASTTIDTRTYSNSTISSNGYTENTGGGQPHNNLQPYIVLNYIIKT